MARWFFPLLMALFLATLVAWAATAPVEQNPREREPPAPVVEPGDVILVELTAWYGDAEGPGLVFWSTQEERHENGTLPFGDVRPRLETEPVRDQVPPEGQAAPAHAQHYAGHRVGEPFTTPRIAPEDAFGDWQENVSVDRTIDRVTVEATFGGPEAPWSEIGFANLTQYEAFWRSRGFSPLEEGTEYPCDGSGRWQCRIVDKSEAGNGTVTIRRLVDENATYDLVPFLGFGASAPGFEGHVALDVAEDGESFEVLLAPRTDAIFQVRASQNPALPTGTYRVQQVGNESFVADYSGASAVPPQLIGSYVWYDLVVVAIEDGST